MDLSRNEPSEEAAGCAALRKYESARGTFVAALRADPAMDRRRIEVGLADLMDSFDGLFSVNQVRGAAATALVIGELAKAGRWSEVRWEIDGFYCDQIAEVHGPCGAVPAQGAA